MIALTAPRNDYFLWLLKRLVHSVICARDQVGSRCLPQKNSIKCFAAPLRSFAFAAAMLAIVMLAGIVAIRTGRPAIDTSELAPTVAIEQPALAFHSAVDMQALQLTSVKELKTNRYQLTVSELTSTPFLIPTQLYDELIFIGANEQANGVVELAFIDNTKKRDFRPIWILSQQPATVPSNADSVPFSYSAPEALTEEKYIETGMERTFRNTTAYYSAFELFHKGYENPHDRIDHGGGNLNFVYVSQLTWVEQGQKLTLSVIGGARTSAKPLEAFVNNFQLQIHK